MQKWEYLVVLVTRQWRTEGLPDEATWSANKWGPDEFTARDLGQVLAHFGNDGWELTSWTGSGSLRY